MIGSNILFSILIVFIDPLIWLIVPSLAIFGVVFHKSISRRVFWGISVILSLIYPIYIFSHLSYFVGGLYKIVSFISTFFILLLSVKVGAFFSMKDRK